MKLLYARWHRGTALTSALAAAHLYQIQTPKRRGLKSLPVLWMTIHSSVRIDTSSWNSSPHGSKSPAICPNLIKQRWFVFAAARRTHDPPRGRLPIVGGDCERSVVTRRGCGKTVCARGAW